MSNKILYCADDDEGCQSGMGKSRVVDRVMLLLGATEQGRKKFAVASVQAVWAG